MPLSSKGRKILSHMTAQYGSKKGKSVFYASINKGKIHGAEKGRAQGGRVTALADVARTPENPYENIVGAAGAIGEQNPAIQALMRQQRGRARAQGRARGGAVEPSQYEFLERDARRAGVEDPITKAQAGEELRRLMEGKAKGGHAGHSPYIVGEKGPEMFVPDEPGTIIPHHELRRLARKYGGRVGGRRRAGGGLVGLQVEQFPGQRKHR